MAKYLVSAERYFLEREQQNVCGVGFENRER